MTVGKSWSNLLFKQPCYIISWYPLHMNFVSCDANILMSSWFAFGILKLR
jgi:hypothetical protein